MKMLYSKRTAGKRILTLLLVLAMVFGLLPDGIFGKPTAKAAVGDIF
jgi:hypothetical protein